MAGSLPTNAFFTNLSTGAIGHSPGFETAVELAAEFGFGGVDPDLKYLRGLPEVDLGTVATKLKDRGLRWGPAGCPVNLNADAATFAAQLAGLEAQAAFLASVGVDRMGTWIRPMSVSTTYRRSFSRLVERVALVDEILAGAGLRFGLEYVGPKTTWSTELHPFIHTLGELLELLDAVGSSNAGIILDTFHWYTAGETVDDLRRLSGDQVVSVDLNDAPAGLDRDDQQDLSRMLPGATGVIDVAGFVGALRDIGYTGPVKVEPFNAELKALPTRDAVAQTAESLRAVL